MGTKIDNKIITNESNTQKKWLVFKVSNKLYAIDSKSVKEVERNSDISPIFFVPPYIKGIINFYGKPYAVIDFSMIQNMPKINTKLFLILNNSSDIALQIDDIIDFYSSEDAKEQQNLDIKDKETDFFPVILTIEKENALILDENSILSKLEEEIEE